MPIYDDLEVRIQQVAEIQITAGGARSADAARLVGGYIVFSSGLFANTFGRGKVRFE